MPNIDFAVTNHDVILKPKVDVASRQCEIIWLSF